MLNWCLHSCRFTILVLLLACVSCKNVLMLFCDDSGRDMGAYMGTPWGQLNNSIVSPNLDYLASHSMVFNNGYTSVSSCSPSRTALLTGMPIHQNGMYGLKNGVHHFRSFYHNDSTIISIPQTIGRLLSNNGYVTGLIGKYHVWPRQVYYFDYLQSEIQGYNMDIIGRNITLMKELMIDFLDNYYNNGTNNKGFYLEMAFHDTHRGCITTSPDGAFCSYLGNGTDNNGIFPDWTPVLYDYKTLELPYWMPDTVAARKEYSAYLTSFSRLDQGVGLFLNILKERGLLNDTLIIFSSDNGPPFPSAKTNLYEEGHIEPFMISIPEFWDENKRKEIIEEQHSINNGRNSINNGSIPPGLIYSDYLASNLDILPTIIDYLNIEYPSYKLNSKTVELTGESLLNTVKNLVTENTRKSNVFGSHVMHEITMYYPMRAVTNGKYRLIHNLHNGGAYHIAEDIFQSATWTKLLNDTLSNVNTNWYKNMSQYYYRSEWELFDIKNDPKQTTNLAYNKNYSNIFNQLSNNITDWTVTTKDPWQCQHNACFN